MAKLKYEVSVAQKGKDDKTYWRRIGVVLQSDKGFSLKLESIPVGWDGWAQLFEPKPREETRPAPAAKQPGSFDQMDDDIPW